MSRVSYTEEQKDSIKTMCVNAAKSGMRLGNCAKLSGVGVKTLKRWLQDDSQFARAFEQARSESLKEVADVMYQQARRGSYQHQAFILSRDKDSPYSDDALKLSPTEQEILEILIQHIMDEQGLLPTQHTCPHCAQPIIIRNGEIVAITPDIPIEKYRIVLSTEN